MMKLIVPLISLGWLLLVGQVSMAGQKTVLIVYSYEESLPWTRQCDRGIRDVLEEHAAITRLYMDTKRIPLEDFAVRAKTTVDVFKRLQPDLVMLSDDNALRLVGPEIAATGVPVVYFGINGNPRKYFNRLPNNVSGLIERIPLVHWIRLLFEIVPGSNSVLVLMDDSPTADAIIQSSFHGRKMIDLGGKVIIWEKADTWSRWRRLVQESEKDIVLMPVYHSLKAADGHHIPVEKVISWTSKNSRKPVFSSQDYAVSDQGVVGAYVIVGEEHGRRAGLMAKGILEGKPIRELSTGDDQQGAFYFNHKQLRRFGIVLPEEVRMRARYR